MQTLGEKVGLRTCRAQGVDEDDEEEEEDEAEDQEGSGAAMLELDSHQVMNLFEFSAPFAFRVD